MSKGWGNGEFNLQANGDQGGRILSQLGGFQVSGKGDKGSKGSRENGESKRNALCIQGAITKSAP